MNKENLISLILNETGAEVFNLGQHPYESRLAYISMIVSLAWADGSIDDREREIIESIAQTAGSDIAMQLDNIIQQNQRFCLEKYDIWIKNLDNKSLKIGLMVDMFLTSFADSVCMQSETIYMKYIAGKLGIDDELYNIIRKNVEEYIKQKSGDSQAVSYEDGIAHQRENRAETEEEQTFRRIVNNLVKTLLLTA
ncbi:MAG: TerB family tellurite resistance protein [Bacteroidales bacterium]|nr:TerB family tellurite resistance protein [Bacteroidales bacterium]